MTIERGGVRGAVRAVVLGSGLNRLLHAGARAVTAVLIGVNKLAAWVMTVRWGIYGVPWFDHRFDYLRGPENWYWCERGVLALRQMPADARVLDVCCGDGTYSGLFYVKRARSVDAIDRDDDALAVARARYTDARLNFRRQDVLADPFPGSSYDLVSFFAALEHFSSAAGYELLQKIGRTLSPQGVLIGSTPIVPHLGGHNDEHDNEFLSEEQVRVFLAPLFGKVELYTSQWVDRGECYFECREPIALDADAVKAALARYDAFLKSRS